MDREQSRGSMSPGLWKAPGQSRRRFFTCLLWHVFANLGGGVLLFHNLDCVWRILSIQTMALGMPAGCSLPLHSSGTAATWARSERVPPLEPGKAYYVAHQQFCCQISQCIRTYWEKEWLDCHATSRFGYPPGYPAGHDLKHADQRLAC